MQTFVLEWEIPFPVCGDDLLPRTVIVVAETESEAIRFFENAPAPKHENNYSKGKPDIIRALPELTGTKAGIVYDSAF